MFGEKNFAAVTPKYPTPVEVPEEMGCRQFSIPASTAWFALVMGCLMQLAEEENWQQYSGGITASDAAAAAQTIIDSGYDNGTCGTGGNIPTPYWDTATDVDDESDPAEQAWYGYVDDPELPPDELTFVEDIGIWVMTGFLAVSGTPAAAILFNTVAEDFVLAMRGNDVGEVIRVIVDAKQHALVDTTGKDGEIIEVPIFTDPDVSPHTILLVKQT